MKDHILPALGVAAFISIMFSIGLVKATMSSSYQPIVDESITCEQLQEGIDSGALKLERK